MELATEAERNEMEAKERKQREFFESMEQNILKSMATGQVTVNSPRPPSGPLRDSLKRPALVRTISSMESAVLKDLVQRVPSHRKMERASSSLKSIGRGYGQRNVLSDIAEASSESVMDEFDEGSNNLGLTADESKALAEFASLSQEMGMDESLSNTNESMSLNESSSGGVALDLSSSGALDFGLSTDFSVSDWQQADNEVENQAQSEEPADKQSTAENDKNGGNDDPRAQLTRKPALIKRNTCGTLHVNTTMSAPDKDATIKVRTTRFCAADQSELLLHSDLFSILDIVNRSVSLMPIPPILPFRFVLLLLLPSLKSAFVAFTVRTLSLATAKKKRLVFSTITRRTGSASLTIEKRNARVWPQ